MSPTLSSHQRLLYTIICLSSLSSPSFGQHLDSDPDTKLQEGIRFMKEKNYGSAQKVFIGLVQDYEENLPPNMSETPRWLLSVAYRKAGEIEKELIVYRELANLYVKEWLDLDSPPPTSKLQNKTVGDLFYNMSNIYYRKGMYPHAKHCGRLAMTIYGNTKDKIMKASAEGLIGKILHRQANLKGNAQEAHQNRIQSMVYTASACRNFREAIAKGSMKSNENYETAFDTLKYLVEALSKNIPKKPKSKEEITDRGLLAKAYVELGQSSYALSNNKKQANRFYKKAYRLYLHANLPVYDWILLSDGCWGIGSLHNAYLVFSTLPKDSKPSHNLCTYGAFLAEKLLEQKEYTKAMKIYGVSLHPFWKAQALSADKALMPSLLTMHEKLADLYISSQQCEAAVTCYNHALAIFHAQNSPSGIMQCNAARDYATALGAHDTNNFAVAAKFSLQAADAFNKLGDRENRTKCLQLCSLASRAQGDFFQTAHTIFELASLDYEDNAYKRAHSQLMSATAALKKLTPTTPKVNELLHACNDLSAKTEQAIHLEKEKQADDNFKKGEQHAKKEAYDAALSCYTAAHKTFVDLKNDSRIDDCLVQMGTIYATQKNRERSIETYTALKKHRIKVYQTTTHPKVAEAMSKIAGYCSVDTKEGIQKKTAILEETLAIQKKCFKQETGDETQENALADTLNDLGTCYHMIGNNIEASNDSSTDTTKQSKRYFEQSMECQQEAFRIRKKNAPNSISLSASYANLAFCFWQQGNAELAIKHYLSAIEICEKLTTSEVKNHIYMRKNLIHIYEATGQLDNALAQAQKAWHSLKNPCLDDIELCQAHIRIYNRQLQGIQLNDETSQAGQQLASKKTTHTNSNLQQKPSSVKHDTTATAQFYTRQIIKWHKKVLTLNEKAESQEGTIEACHELSNFLYTSNKFQEALPYLQKAYSMATETSNTNNMPTGINSLLKADISYALGMNLSILGNHKEAIAPFLQACELYEKEPTYGETHVCTINGYTGLSNCFAKNMQFPRAIAYYEKVIRGYLSFPLKDRSYDLQLASIYHEIAYACSQDHQQQAALQYYHKSRELQEKYWNLKNPSAELAAIYTSIGTHYFEKAERDSNPQPCFDYSHAKSWYLRALEVHKAVSQKSGYCTNEQLNTWLHIAKTEETLDNHSEAAQCYKLSLPIAKKIYKKNEPLVGKIFSALAFNQYHLAEYMQSFQNGQEANRILRQSPPSYSLDRAITLYTLGSACDKLGIICCLDKKMLSPENLKPAKLVMLCSMNKKMIPKQKKYFNMAIDYFKEVVKIRRKYLPEKAPLIGTALAVLALSYRRTKQVEKYINAYMEAIDIAQHNNDPVTLKQYVLQIKEVCQEGINYYTTLQKRELERGRKARKQRKKESKYTHLLTTLNKYLLYDPKQPISLLQQSSDLAKEESDTSVSETPTEELTTSDELTPFPPIATPAQQSPNGNNLHS